MMMSPENVFEGLSETRSVKISISLILDQVKVTTKSQNEKTVTISTFYFFNSVCDRHSKVIQLNLRLVDIHLGIIFGNGIRQCLLESVERFKPTFTKLLGLERQATCAMREIHFLFYSRCQSKPTAIN